MFCQEHCEEFLQLDQQHGKQAQPSTNEVSLNGPSNEEKNRPGNRGRWTSRQATYASRGKSAIRELKNGESAGKNENPAELLKTENENSSFYDQEDLGRKRNALSLAGWLSSMT